MSVQIYTVEYYNTAIQQRIPETDHPDEIAQNVEYVLLGRSLSTIFYDTLRQILPRYAEIAAEKHFHDKLTTHRPNKPRANVTSAGQLQPAYC